MADKDLGALIVRLQADVTQLKIAVDGVQNLGKETEVTQTKVNGLKDKFVSLGKVITPLISSFGVLRTVMKIDNKFTEQVKIQEEAVARLGSAIRSTGGIAGLTIKDFDKMAESLQNASTRTMAEITNTQSIIAAFTNIRGKVFTDTMTTVLNLADAFEMDLTQVARSVGKALQNPTKGMLSLQRIGLGLTPVVQAQVKAFMSVNDVLSAQNLILDFLKTRLDWTSEMLAATLPGAIQQTKNAWDNLFRVGGTEGTERYRKSLIELRDALQTDEMKEFFKTIGSGWYTLKSLGMEIAQVVLKFKELIVITGITAALVALASTIKLVVIPVIVGIGTAFSTAFGPVGLVIAATIASLSTLAGFTEDVINRFKKLGNLANSFDLDKLKKRSMGHGMTAKSIALSVYDSQKLAPRTDTQPSRWADTQGYTTQAIEGMTEAAQMTQQRMTYLLDSIKFGSKSAAQALKEVTEEMKAFKNPQTVLNGVPMFDESYKILQKTKEMLESITGKSMKSYAKASKEAFTEMVNGIKNQMELLDTPGESFLPGLKEMLNQFPVLSEKWVSLKQLIISIEKEIRDAQIENARIVREYRQRQEEESLAKRREIMKREEEMQTKYSSFNKLGFISDDTALKKYLEDYRNMMKDYGTDPSQFMTWSDPLIKAYEKAHDVVLNKLQPVMDHLTDQYNNGTISIEQYRQATQGLTQDYADMPGVQQIIINQTNAQIEAYERAKVTIASLADTAQRTMLDTFQKIPDSLAEISAEALVMSENIGDALQRIGQELEQLAIKAALMQIFKSLFGNSWDNLISGMFSKGSSSIVTSLPIGPQFATGGVFTSPTMFPTGRGGAGLMSEDGPEAVVPLGKTKDGKLGITMSGSASGSIFAPHIEVNVQNTGTGEMSEDQAKRLGTQLDAMVKVEVAEAMYDWKRKKAI